MAELDYITIPPQQLPDGSTSAGTDYQGGGGGSTDWGALIDAGVDVASLFGGAYFGNNEQGKTQEWGSNAKNELMGMGQDAINNTKFNPVGVVSNTGNVTTDANGNIISTLNQGQQNASNAALGAATGLFGEAGVSVADRTQDIYGGAAAAMQGGFQMNNTAMANGLYASGRTGFASAGFGGSSEQFANAQSQEQSMMNAYFGARQQAGTEQANQAQAAGSLLGSSMLGDGTMFNQHNSAINQGNLVQTGQIAGSQQNSQLGIAGVQTQLQGQMQAQDQRYGMMAGGQAQAESTDWGSVASGAVTVVDWLADLF